MGEQKSRSWKDSVLRVFQRLFRRKALSGIPQHVSRQAVPSKPVVRLNQTQDIDLFYEQLNSYRPPLPPEITDLILYHIRTDRATLLKCAQVCTAWVPASRTFSMERNISIPRSDEARVIDLLESPHSTFPAYLRSIGMFLPDPSIMDSSPLLDTFIQTKVTPVDLDVQVYVLDQYTGVSTKYEVIETLFSWCKHSIRHLQIATSSCSMSQMLTSISGCSKLESLSLSSSLYFSDYEEIPPDIHPPSTLTSLKLKLKPDALAFVALVWLERWPETDVNAALNLHLSLDDTSHFWKHYLSQSHPMLRVLTGLNIEPYTQWSFSTPAWDWLDCQHLISLRHIRVGVVMYLLDAVHILRSLPPGQQLDTFHVCLSQPNDLHIQDPHIGTTDDQLMICVADDADVSLIFHGSIDSDEGMREKFRKCSAQTRFTFTVSRV